MPSKVWLSGKNVWRVPAREGDIYFWETKQGMAALEYAGSPMAFAGPVHHT